MGSRKIPIRRKGVHDRLGVAHVQSGLVAADHVTWVGVPGPEYREA